MFFKVIKLSKILFVLTIIVCIGIIFSIGSNKIMTASINGNEQTTLIIDAGHGGIDGGAQGISGITEQVINLSIAKKTNALAGFLGINAIMTRESDSALDFQDGRSIRKNKVADTKARERIANDAQNPIFISIHLNKFDNEKYSGAQVFYSKNNPLGKKLATALQTTFRDGLNANNNRKEKVANDSIYLMKKLQCPAVIVECGFLSNPNEEKLLIQETYHKKISICILSGFLNYSQKENF